MARLLQVKHVGAAGEDDDIISRELEDGPRLGPGRGGERDEGEEDTADAVGS